MVPLSPRGFRTSIESALRRLPENAPFATVFQHGTLSVEIFAPREVDTQQPHTRDEAYVVLRGTGDFVNGNERHKIGPGDFLFVPAGVVHRFENFTRDLAVWVIFYGPEGGEDA
jgi:mannose-6-phosphate isomerase-like protein (cupin superfamily)